MQELYTRTGDLFRNLQEPKSKFRPDFSGPKKVPSRGAVLLLLSTREFGVGTTALNKMKTAMGPGTFKFQVENCPGLKVSGTFGGKVLYATDNFIPTLSIFFPHIAFHLLKSQTRCFQLHLSACDAAHH